MNTGSTGARTDRDELPIRFYEVGPARRARCTVWPGRHEPRMVPVWYVGEPHQPRRAA